MAAVCTSLDLNIGPVYLIYFFFIFSGVDMTGLIKSLGINIGRVTEGAAAAVGCETSASIATAPEEALGEVAATESLQRGDVAEAVAAEVAGSANSVEVP